jgi:hypothetical protein
LIPANILKGTFIRFIGSVIRMNAREAIPIANAIGEPKMIRITRIPVATQK